MVIPMCHLYENLCVIGRFFQSIFCGCLFQNLYSQFIPRGGSDDGRNVILDVSVWIGGRGKGRRDGL